ncbi:hypothetical protein GCM10028803_25540 [Larkinella knui]|uniref:DUF5683 domain-containing protein n=1 Tax=Larkinella knui TaxID=2025310 RepID=A0A3P1CWZ3_9BACT|nr:DUF5683 domain-containing protein [Larkinella knui]RRB17606.1 hypothetical protein EHT87_04810 [Larkinella knui]
MKTEYRVTDRMKWKNYVGAGMLMMLGGMAWGQNPAVAVPDGKTVQISTDSLRMGLPADTLPLSPKQNANIRKIVPRTATIRSAMLPGLGQIHNGHWWKVPIIYAGFGTMVYFSQKYSNQYRFYRKYGIIANYSPGQTASVPGYTDPIAVAQLERAARAVARYRDYNYLGIGLLWGVNVIEANVTAHLKTFDISEDLTMKIKPGLLMPITGGLPVPGIRVAFQFTN